MSKDNDLQGYYPDLSDEEDNQEQDPKKEETLPNSQPHKITKPNEPIDSNKPPVFTAPKLFGGRNFIPPPPPPGSKKTHYPPPQPTTQQPQRPNLPNFRSNSGGSDSQQPRVERERKNCVFVKNIPKHYNEVDKLMTFFKNEGAIKEIRVNHEQSSAMVKFIKEECALRFVNSKKDIFNRSFIVYSLNDKEVVPEQLLLEKQNEETGKVKKAEVQLKFLKERIELVLTDKIRALLFARKYATEESLSAQMSDELMETIALKQYVIKNGLTEMGETSKCTVNDYDWTLNFKISREHETEKKSVIYELQKKYGSISTLELVPLTIPESTPDQPATNKHDYLVKMTLLGVRQSWECYCERKAGQEEVQVEGAKLRNLFDEGMIKQTTRQMAMSAEAARLKEVAEQILEVMGQQHGQVIEVVDEQPEALVIQQQVDVPDGHGSQPEQKEEKAGEEDQK